MTKQLELARPPYTPPYAAERAWEPDGRDDWILHAMRAGLTDALEASIKMDERNPEMRQQVGVETVRFRSNRLRGSSIDADIVNRVMALELDEIEELGRWRHDNADELDAYPRACLDAFQQDITTAVDEAGQWDKTMAVRWGEAVRASHVVAVRWLNEDDTHQLQAVQP